VHLCEQLVEITLVGDHVYCYVH